MKGKKTGEKDLMFAERLRTLYAALPYDQRDLARSVGVSMATLLQWEEGDKVPTVTQLKKVAVYFGLPCEFFLEDLPPAPEKPEDPLLDWQIADRLGLSESTVERLKELAEAAPGDVLDSVDETIYSLTETTLAARGNWNRD